MSMQLFGLGMLIGALAAFPLGPVGMLCVQRALHHGARSSLATASAIALASGLWCVVALLGLKELSDKITLGGPAFRIVLGGFLVVVAVKNLRRPGVAGAVAVNHRKLAGDFLFTFLIVSCNPITLVTVTALLAAFGLARVKLNPAGVCGLSLAVFAGGVGFWLILSWALASLRARLGDRVAGGLSRSCSVALLILGLAYLVSAIWVRR
jgi:threonine/homoserine/homoserine lactone efflux protein